MRFLRRALAGASILVLTLLLVGTGLWRIGASMDADPARRGPPAVERSYIVETAELTSTSITPVMTAYGTVQAWRNLEIRAATPGVIARISDNFRDGASVQAGEELFAVDPQTLETRLADIELAEAEAEAALAEAKSTLNLARQEAAIVERQATVRREELQRQQQLRGRGVVAQAVVDAANLALTTAEQAVIARRQAVLSAEARLHDAELGLRRAEILLSDAQRDLEEASFAAPFAGLLDDVEATLGRRISQNERLGLLIDPSALEVEFGVRAAEFARLIDARQQLEQRPVTVVLDLGDRQIELPGRLDRAGATVDSNIGGRRLYARLLPEDGGILRPGDFVTVKVQESELQNVAVLPATAVSQDGRLFLIDDQQRLEEVTVTVLSRDDEQVIVSGAPFGRAYVARRLPQLAPGVKVQPRGAGDQARPGAVSLEQTRGKGRS